MRVSARGETLGCLYNFVYGGRVLYYQAGFAEHADPHVKSGVLCHVAAIEHAAKSGHAIYDLLGGGGSYKERLATSTSRIAWLRVQRPLVRFAIEDYLIAAKRRSSRLLGAAVGARSPAP